MNRANDDRDAEAGASARSSLIYCGLCGALNPAGNHYCAACGTTLIDAFHATEGMRVYERPDSASRLIEIVPAGNALDIIENPETPADFVRVRLPQGHLGYIRLQEIATQETLPTADRRLFRSPDINTNARGCVSTTGALAALALLVVVAAFGLVLIFRANAADALVLSIVFCVAVVPLLLLTIGLYLAARSREGRQIEEEEDARLVAASDSDRGEV